jgi:hypothetical protein
MDDPVSIMLPLYEGRTCIPPGYNYTDTCTQGGYPTYVVNATTVAQIQMAVNFARNPNLRLVVENTGHDFNGKAAGKGALSIWTHWLKDKAFYPEYHADNGYVGPAIKFGAGAQVWEAYEFANENGVSHCHWWRGCDCWSGVGYTASGGHSPLSSLYGMAADQVLSMEGTSLTFFEPISYPLTTQHEIANEMTVVLADGHSSRLPLPKTLPLLSQIICNDSWHTPIPAFNVECQAYT